MGRYSLAALIAVMLAAPAAAQELGPASDTTRYALDTGLFLIAGFGAILFVFAFCLRDIGLARTQHAPAVCLRTVGLLGVTVFAFWATGYNLIHTVETGGLLGDFEFWMPDDADPLSVGHSTGAYWFFQMGLAAIPSVIVASAVSERVKLWPFLIFAALMGGLVYPIVAAWVWGGGYFGDAWRLKDLGGASAIHITGGAAALAAALVVGARHGRFQDGAPQRLTPTTALPLSAFAGGVGVIAWIAVLAGLAGSFSTIEAAISAGTMAVNAALAAAAAALTGLALTQIVYKRAGLVTSINALFAGLVAISADPLHPSLWQAVMIGAVGGVIVTVAPPFLERFRLDDAGFVIPAHLMCGAWGVIIVPWSNPEAWFPGQIAGIVSAGGFSFALSGLIWTALKYSIGVRSRPPEETQSELLRESVTP